MLILHSFLQSVLLFVRSLVPRVSKQMYRSACVIISGATVIAVVSFSSQGFGGSGKNALAASLIEEDGQDEETQEEQLEEGIEQLTEAKVQIELTDTGSTGQSLAGELLVKKVRRQEKIQETAKAEIQSLQREIVKQQREERARLEEEAARKKAEAARQAREEERRKARQISYTEEDYQVLLQIVEAEAGICDEKGKILVADVIINRVLSDQFPDSVKAVVYEPSQFQPVSNGTIHSVRISAETVACVDRALAGEDYSQGALYFMNRRASGRASSWFDRHLDYLFTHDGHEFFK